MDLIDRFLPQQYPRQYVYFSEAYLRLLVPQKSSGKPSFQDLTVEGSPLSGRESESLDAIWPRLKPMPTGLLLGPHAFIYNLFAFERIPWNPRLRREIVEWKLDKVFPEKISGYLHSFFSIDRRTILSVLVKKESILSLEAAFGAAKVPVTYIGNSTLELIGRLFRGRRAPDLLIEWDRSCVVTAFQHRRRLSYIRKFRGESEGDIGEELERTVQFVRSQLGLKPKTYLVCTPGLPASSGDLAQLLGRLEMTEVAPAPGKIPYLPISR